MGAVVQTEDLYHVYVNGRKKTSNPIMGSRETIKYCEEKNFIRFHDLVFINQEGDELTFSDLEDAARF